MVKEIVLDFTNSELEEDAELRDPHKWREDIKQAAMKSLGLSEQEAEELLEAEAPLDLLKDELEMEVG